MMPLINNGGGLLLGLLLLVLVLIGIYCRAARRPRQRRPFRCSCPFCNGGAA